ncbi:hypothetical protein HOLleu_07231 [Holothuria leucospilota]|uniref:Uncharacterized protein n=1 Tax=Holothuria leucospilota TaxID=206669 RepID=A0A9Q1CH12_HOLLE|nr:hypothetical protein HOLleu_07231 [Holothuria leucospilota]
MTSKVTAFKMVGTFVIQTMKFTNFLHQSNPIFFYIETDDFQSHIQFKGSTLQSLCKQQEYPSDNPPTETGLVLGGNCPKPLLGPLPVSRGNIPVGDQVGADPEISRGSRWVISSAPKMHHERMVQVLALEPLEGYRVRTLVGPEESPRKLSQYYTGKELERKQKTSSRLVC